MSLPIRDERTFVAALVHLAARQDLGALAALRRGLGRPPGTVGEMHPFVVPLLPDEPRPPREAERRDAAYYLVAALFAWHPVNWTPDDPRRPSNLGASLTRLMSDNASASTDRRVVALLNCHVDDLQNHLRGAVGLLRSKEIPVDWARLLVDIPRWGDESRHVQRQWARAFWGVRRPDVAAETEPAA